MSEREANSSATISFNESGTVFLRGELDLTSRHLLKSLARAMLANGDDTVDFDLSNVSFTDSAGWRSVCSAAQLLNSSGRTARIINPSPAVRKVTDVLGSSHRPPGKTHTQAARA